MALGYTKEFLLDAFAHRYKRAYSSEEDRIHHRNLAEVLYNTVGKDKFRVYASLDADAIKKFKLESRA